MRSFKSNGNIHKKEGGSYYVESLPLATVTGSRLLSIHITCCFLNKFSEITSDQEDQYLCMLTFHNEEKLTFES